MVYNCKICSYDTRDLSNFLRHKKSLKHKNKSSDNIKVIISDQKIDHKNKSFKCISCDKGFTSKTNMYRHRREYCKGIIDAQKQIEELKKQNEMLLKLATSNARTAENNSEVTKKSVSVGRCSGMNFSRLTPYKIFWRLAATEEGIFNGCIHNWLGKMCTVLI